MTIEPSTPLSENADNGVQLTSLMTEILKKLGNINSQEDILQTSVEIIYQVLKCDRVVVYSMQSESLCKIVAEAVTPGYAQILNTTIQDPCFEERYIDKYQKGRVRAITNIQEAGMSPCYVENLEKIDVKSNLVVPLTRQDRSLYGLLVMHQCSKIREWQQSEIEFALQIADWTIEQLFQQHAYQKLDNQLKNNKKVQQIIYSLVKVLHCATTSNEVLQLAVDETQKILNCDRVVVYSLQDRNKGKIVAEATVPALASILGNVIIDPCFEYRYLKQYQQGRIRSIPNIYEAGMTPCYIDNLAKIGVKANLVAPINWDNGEIFGLLVAHQCFSFKDWQSEEIEYIKQIAFHTGLCLSKAQINDKLQAIEASYAEINSVKDRINLAQSKIQQIQKPIQNTSQILVEINNLNKLLAREINLINQNGSAQTKKDTKLIQIIINKLAIITSKLKQSLNIVDSSKNEADNILSQAIVNINGNKK